MNAVGKSSPVTWEFILYVAGSDERAKSAVDELKKICDIYIEGPCNFQVVDLKKHPELAAKKEIFALPTLVKELPPPVRAVIGDLRETKKVLVGLGIHRIVK